MNKILEQQQRLTPEQCQLIENNQRLVYYIMQNKFHIHRNDINYEEICMCAERGLLSAVINFDESRGYQFGTFAGKCIINEIRMYIRKSKRYSKRIAYLGDYIRGKNDTEIPIEDMIEDSKQNIEEKIILNQEFEEVVDIILNCLKPRDTIIMLYWISGSTLQRQLGERLGISRSYVSRIERKSLKLIRKIANENIKYIKTFRIEKKKYSYHISFLKTDIGDWNTIFNKILEKHLYGYEITCDDQKITIKVLADLESFYIVAQIFDVIYEYSLRFDKKATYR